MRRNRRRLSSPEPIEPVEFSGEARDAFLERVWAQRIANGLERSLQHAAEMQLGLRNTPELVKLSYSDSTAEPGEVLGIDAAYQEAGRQLVILGPPGSGKTTEALKLMRSLLETARNDPTAAVPELFPLASWGKQRRPLLDWLSEQLQLRHGWPPSQGRALIWNHAVMPVLDGLDEIAPEHRAACVQAINRFWETYRDGPLVLCSRQAEYEEIGERVQLGGAVVVRPPDSAAIDMYLAAAGPGWDSVRAQLRAGSSPLLLELFTTPLMLSIAVLAYEGRDSREIGEDHDAGPQRDRLWSRYVSAMRIRGYDPDATEPPDAAPYTQEEVALWLGWLAQEMRSKNETEFWLHEWSGPPRLRSRVRTATGSVLGLGLGLGLGPGNLSQALPLGLVLAALSGFAVWLSGERLFKPAPAYRVPLDLRRLAGSLLRGAGGGLGGGLAFGAFGTPRDLHQPETTLLIFALATGAVFALLSLAALWSGRGQLPNPASARPGLAPQLRALIAWLLVGAFIWLVGSQSSSETLHALAGALIFGLFFGGALRRETAPRNPTRGPARVIAGRLLIGLFAAVAFVLTIEMLGKVDQTQTGLVVGLVIGLAGALLLGLGFALTSFSLDRERFAPISPTQLITASARIGLLFGLIFGLPAGMIAGWATAQFPQFSSQPGYWVMEGLIFAAVIGLSVGLRFGLDCALYHLVFRIWLRLHGRGPLRWVGFLEWSCDHLLLRSTSASYEWVHLELRDYMARQHTPVTPAVPALQ